MVNNFLIQVDLPVTTKIMKTLLGQFYQIFLVTWLPLPLLLLMLNPVGMRYTYLMAQTLPFLYLIVVIQQQIQDFLPEDIMVLLIQDLLFQHIQQVL